MVKLFYTLNIKRGGRGGRAVVPRVPIAGARASFHQTVGLLTYLFTTVGYGSYNLQIFWTQSAICLITTVQMPTSALTDVTIPCFILPANLLPKITPPDRAVII